MRYCHFGLSLLNYSDYDPFIPDLPLVLKVLGLIPAPGEDKFGIQTYFIFLLVTETINSISDHYLRSCGYVTCSWPQRRATGGLKPGTSWPKVLGFTGS